MEFIAYSCDGVTGTVLDRLPVSAMTYDRLLSAGGAGSVTIPFDGTFTRAQLRNLLEPWQRIIVLERDGRVEYGGYVLGRQADLAGTGVTVQLADLWTLLGRRGGWDRSHPKVVEWSTTVTGTLGVQAWQAVHRARNTLTTKPDTKFPVTNVSTGGGSTVTRTVRGYHLEYVTDLWDQYMAEGLDIYLQPRWRDGNFDWGFRAGPAWVSGVTREYAATVEDPVISKLSVSDDASRMTNNAVRVGEGTEVDMLARSNRDLESAFPALDRITAVKTVDDPLQLQAQCNVDLAMFGRPTEQWNFAVLASAGVDVGDTVRIHTAGDRWIPDGWHTRRVVKVSGSTSDFVQVGVQPVGGA